MTEKDGEFKKALEGVAELIALKNKEIKELRTRVAEQEKQIRQIVCRDCLQKSSEASERIIELEKENGNILKDFEELRMKSLANEELQTRLSTLEQSILDLSHPNIKNILSELNQYKSKTVNVVEFHKLEDRLSTLLKASEGMEKALEPFATDQGFIESEFETARKALADFRAVKEWK